MNKTETGSIKAFIKKITDEKFWVVIINNDSQYHITSIDAGIHKDFETACKVRDSHLKDFFNIDFNEPT